jgi:hypothetical protein
MGARQFSTNEFELIPSSKHFRLNGGGSYRLYDIITRRFELHEVSLEKIKIYFHAGTKNRVEVEFYDDQRQFHNFNDDVAEVKLFIVAG